MALTFREELALQAALMEIKLERRRALREMFEGTQLVLKDKTRPAREVAGEAKKAYGKVKEIPGVGVPNLRAPDLDLNLDLLKGLDLRGLARLPSLSFPNIGFDWNLIPDIRLGDLPGFDLPRIRIQLKGLLKYKDLFPDIRLRALILRIHLRFPGLEIPYIIWELGRIFQIDFSVHIPALRVWLPSLPQVSLPNLAIPDVNLPRIAVPDVSLNINIDLPSLEIPGINLPRLLRIPGFDRVLKLLLELFDIGDLPDIVQLIGLDVFLDFVSSALPVVQQLKSGAAAVNEFGSAIQDQWKAHRTHEHEKFVVPGDARAACGALRTLLKQSSAEHAARGTVNATQFAVSTAGLFADLGAGTGPAVAAGASLAKLGIKITVVAARYREVKRVNHILSTNSAEGLGREIFDVSPLLGCYFIVNSTTSTILNVLADDILTDGWMNDAERNKREHLDPLVRDSQAFIGRSHYVLTPLRQTKGMYVERSTFDRLTETFSLYVRKKMRLAPQDARVTSHRYLGS